MSGTALQTQNQTSVQKKEALNLDKVMSKVEKLLLGGDLAQLSADERLLYYKNLCNTLGLNPLTRPFEYVTFNGKLQLYARKDCTEQLRKIYEISIIDCSMEEKHGCIIAKATAESKCGRKDVDYGAVPLNASKPMENAKAIKVAATQAKRRVTLSICGLGVVDESELDGIKDHKLVNVDPNTGEILDVADKAKPVNASSKDKLIGLLKARLQEAIDLKVSSDLIRPVQSALDNVDAKTEKELTDLGKSLAAGIKIAKDANSVIDIVAE